MNKTKQSEKKTLQQWQLFVPPPELLSPYSAWSSGRPNRARRDRNCMQTQAKQAISNHSMHQPLKFTKTMVPASEQ
jgi:hypothetical protein